MATWSSRRKFRYAFWGIFAVIVLIVIPTFLLLYEAPTCFDGKKNGGELDVDCGGRCERLCQSAFLPPKIAWGGAKFEKISDGIYNVASYIINPNLNGAATDVPYKISFYDSSGVLITEIRGSMNIGAHRNALAFEPSVKITDRIPAKAIFEFTKSPEWFKSEDLLEGLTIVDRNYREEGTSSSLEVTLENRTLLPYQNIEVSAILYDIGGNAIGFSRTKVDYIGPKDGRETAIFTWPFSRNGRVTSIEIIPLTLPSIVHPAK